MGRGCLLQRRFPDVGASGRSDGRFPQFGVVRSEFSAYSDQIFDGFATVDSDFHRTQGVLQSLCAEPAKPTDLVECSGGGGSRWQSAVVRFREILGIGTLERATVARVASTVAFERTPG